MLSRFIVSGSVLALFLSVLPSVASACAVCFGGGSSNLVRGFTWGVVLLLALPFVLMTALVTAIARATRRQKNHE